MAQSLHRKALNNLIELSSRLPKAFNSGKLSGLSTTKETEDSPPSDGFWSMLPSKSKGKPQQGKEV
jgi:hypothetical protein